MPVMSWLPRSSSSDETGLSLPRPLKKFYLGEPLALGIVQIFTAIIGIAFGIAMEISLAYRDEYFVVKTPHWTGILYIISGSLSVAASRNPKMSLVKGMLGMNIVSTFAAGIAIIFLSNTLGTFYPSCFVSYACEHESSPEAQKQCITTLLVPLNTVCGMLIVILAFTILEFCITIATAAFGCKAVCRDAYAETVVVVYQNMTPVDTASQTTASKDPETL